MDIRVIETIVVGVLLVVFRFFVLMFLSKIQEKYNYSKYRVRPIFKFVNFFVFITIVILLVAIWGVQQTKILTFVSSVLAVVGIALVAQWSILSNVSSSFIIFISHPVKLGEAITILDKDFDITGKVTDIGLFYLILKTATNEKITIPNNLFLQKAIRVNL